MCFFKKKIVEKATPCPKSFSLLVPAHRSTLSCINFSTSSSGGSSPLQTKEKKKRENTFNIITYETWSNKLAVRCRISLRIIPSLLNTRGYSIIVAVPTYLYIYIYCIRIKPHRCHIFKHLFFFVLHSSDPAIPFAHLK